MKTNQKIMVGISAVVFILALIFSLYYLLLPVMFERLSYDSRIGKFLSYHLNDEVETTSILADSAVDKLLDNLELGSIAYNPPKTMELGASHTIQLMLSRSEAVEELKKAIVLEGERVGAEIQVSNRMTAKLSGSEFDITEKQSATQAIPSNERTVWEWVIHPKSAGTHELHLTIEAHLMVDGQDTPRKIETYDNTIEVTITTTRKIQNFLTSYWQWLLGVIVIPGLIQLYRKWKKT